MYKPFDTHVQYANSSTASEQAPSEGHGKKGHVHQEDQRYSVQLVFFFPII